MKLRVSQLWHYIETWGFHKDIENIKDFANNVTDDDDNNNNNNNNENNNNNNNNKDDNNNKENNNDKFGYFGVSLGNLMKKK